MRVEQNNFCRRPFSDLVIEPTGLITPCCVVHLGRHGRMDFAETNVEKFLRSPELLALQNEFLENKRPNACQICWDKEGVGESLLAAESLEFFQELLRRNLNEKHYLVFTNLSQLNFHGVYYPDFWQKFPQTTFDCQL
jgi:hypothetical protein